MLWLLLYLPRIVLGEFLPVKAQTYRLYFSLSVDVNAAILTSNHRAKGFINEECQGKHEISTVRKGYQAEPRSHIAQHLEWDLFFILTGVELTGEAHDYTALFKTVAEDFDRHEIGCPNRTGSIDAYTWRNAGYGSNMNCEFTITLKCNWYCRSSFVNTNIFSSDPIHLCTFLMKTKGTIYIVYCSTHTVKSSRDSMRDAVVKPIGGR